MKQEHSFTVGTPTTFTDDWCVYEHYIRSNDPTGAQPPTLIYIGACRLRDVFKLTDAGRNSEWRKIVTPETPLMISIVETGGRIEMQRSVGNRCRQLPSFPRCNLFGHDAFGIQKAIVCSNGKTYASQIEAARSLNLDQGAISKHMRGELRTVKGFTFAYAEDQR